MPYIPEHLKPWTDADPATGTSGNYAGVRPVDCYIAAFRHRDSDLLTESNWDATLQTLIPNGERNRCYVQRQGHWAVGWTEYLLIHRTASGTLKLADELAAKLQDYPVLDEDDFSVREWNAAQDHWTHCSLQERIDLCRKAGLSIFAARQDSIPPQDNGYIFESCRPC